MPLSIPTSFRLTPNPKFGMATQKSVAEMDAHIKARMAAGDMTSAEGYQLGAQLADAILGAVAADPDEFQRRLDAEIADQKKLPRKPV